LALHKTSGHKTTDDNAVCEDA